MRTSNHSHLGYTYVQVGYIFKAIYTLGDNWNLLRESNPDYGNKHDSIRAIALEIAASG